MTETTNTVSKTETTETVERIDLAAYNPTFVWLSYGELVELESSGNWREEDDYARLAPERWASMSDTGQETPIWIHTVVTATGAKKRLGRGHLRRRGFMFGYDTEGEEAFNAKFPRGIAALHLDCSTEQMARLKSDNAHSENMRLGAQGKMDCTMQAVVLFQDGLDRQEVILQLEPQVNAITPAYEAPENGSRLKEIDNRQSEIASLMAAAQKKIAASEEKVKSTDNEEAREAFEQLAASGRDDIERLSTERKKLAAERETIVVSIRKGQGDKFVQHYMAGLVADWVLYHEVKGVKHPEAEFDTNGWRYDTKKFLPQLARAVKKDFGIATFSPDKFTKEQRALAHKGTEAKAVLEKFQTAAEKRLTEKAERKAKKAAGESTAKAKRMDAKAIQLWGEGQTSDSAKTLANVFSGAIKTTDPEVSDKLKTATTDMEVGELLRKHRAKFWREVVMAEVAKVKTEIAATEEAAKTAAKTETKPAPKKGKKAAPKKGATK